MKQCSVGVSQEHIQFICRLFNWKGMIKQKQKKLTGEAAVTPTKTVKQSTQKIKKHNFTCRLFKESKEKQKATCEAIVSQNNSQTINPEK